MKKIKCIMILALFITAMLGNLERAKAQFIVGDIIRLTVTKVIKAIDLKVQRMQNKTIWLQNAQKALENELAKFRLTEISTWSDKQRQLYSNYYTELWKIKSAIAYYQRIRDLMARQSSLVTQYSRTWALFRQDAHFTPGELNHMQSVYSGILLASAENLDQILLVVNSFKTQMTDEQRMELIDRAGDRLDENFSDLQEFNNQNIQISLHRSKDLNDTKAVKNLYGIN